MTATRITNPSKAANTQFRPPRILLNLKPTGLYCGLAVNCRRSKVPNNSKVWITRVATTYTKIRNRCRVDINTFYYSKTTDKFIIWNPFIRNFNTLLAARVPNPFKGTFDRGLPGDKNKSFIQLLAIYREV